MPLPHIEITSEWAPNLSEFLDRQMYEYNSRTTGFADGRALVGEVRDETQALIGCVSGHSWGGSCELQWFWVHESKRRQGLGRALMMAAESTAVQRGCIQIVLLTHSFQAPTFYERLGFIKVGEVANYPLGHAKLLYVKQLIQQ